MNNPISVKVAAKYHVESFKSKFDTHTEKNLTRAAIYLTNAVKKTVNKAKSPPASSPGEPPHREHGALMQSIQWEVDKKEMTARVGSNLKYAKYLELGTKDMGARPFLLPTFTAERNTIARILTTRMG